MIKETNGLDSKLVLELKSSSTPNDACKSFYKITSEEIKGENTEKKVSNESPRPRRILFKIPDEYMDTCFSQIPVEAIFSNIYFNSENGKAAVVSSPYKFDHNLFNSKNEEFYPPMNVIPNKNLETKRVFYFDDKGGRKEDSIKSVIRGSEIKERIDEKIENVTNIFIKVERKEDGTKSLIKVQDNMNYNIVDDTEFLCMSPVKTANEIRVKVQIDKDKDIDEIEPQIKNKKGANLNDFEKVTCESSPLTFFDPKCGTRGRYGTKKKQPNVFASYKNAALEKQADNSQTFNNPTRNVIYHSSEASEIRSQPLPNTYPETKEKINFIRCDFYNDLYNNLKMVLNSEPNDLELLCDIAQIKYNNNKQEMNQIINFVLDNRAPTSHQIYDAISSVCKNQNIECPVDENYIEKFKESINESNKISIMTFIDAINSSE